MKTSVKRIINFRQYRYKALEEKLEIMAQEGLFLKKIGTFFWSFEKDMPSHVKYTVTYISDASVFNPKETQNQQAFYATSKDLGWDFVAQSNQMQIFKSTDENPKPLYANEGERLTHIKRCMNKTFVPLFATQIAVLLLNLGIFLDQLLNFPIDFFANHSRVFPVALIFPAFIYFVYLLADYLIWAKQSEKAIRMGGSCVEKNSKMHGMIDTLLMVYLAIVTGLFILNMIQNKLIFTLLFILFQVPVLAILFKCAIQYFKKKEKSARTNRILSFSLLIIASFAYVALMVFVLFHYDMPNQNTQTSTYTKTVDESLFMTRTTYRHLSIPTNTSVSEPSLMEYTLIEPNYTFVYDMVEKDMKKQSEPPIFKLVPIDSKAFNAVDAYQVYCGEEQTGEYHLFYKDKILSLSFTDSIGEKQIDQIKNNTFPTLSQP